MASTSGSAAACSRNACTLVANESYGWCTRTSPAQDRGEDVGGLPGPSPFRSGCVLVANGGKRRSCTPGAADVGDLLQRRSGPAARPAGTPRPRRCPARGRAGPAPAAPMCSSTSRRTGGPKRRRTSSRSSAWSRSSSLSSSTSRSSLRVTRNAWLSTISMPGNSCPRCAEMRSSTGTNAPPSGRPDEPRQQRRAPSRRAKCSWPPSGSRTETARFSDSPEMYGNGCAGSTASGVSTGKICSRNSAQPVPLAVVQVLPATGRMPVRGQLRAQLVLEQRRRAGPPGRRSRPGSGAARSRSGSRTPRRGARRWPAAALQPGDPHHVELVEVATRRSPGTGPAPAAAPGSRPRRVPAPVR